jgi:hypothetical protein
MKSEQAVQLLREFVPAGTTIYGVLRHKSQSGQYKVYDLYYIQNNEPRRITFNAALAADLKYDRKHEGIGIRAVGLNPVVQIVELLSRAMFAELPAEVRDYKLVPQELL